MSVDARVELHQAIVDNQLVLHYQPIVAVADRKIVAVEGLVRWRHPTRGILPPSQFVAAIERAGLALVKLGRALVARRGTDPQSRSDAGVIVKSAKERRRSVTAVGIEDARSWSILAELGCDAAQGFAVAPALSTADLALWRERH